jgi:hypothetical protein
MRHIMEQGTTLGVLNNHSVYNKDSGYILVNRSKGFSPFPTVHDDYQEAVDESVRLARKEPGDTFEVFRVQSYSTVIAPTVVQHAFNFGGIIRG